VILRWNSCSSLLLVFFPVYLIGVSPPFDFTIHQSAFTTPHYPLFFNVFSLPCTLRVAPPPFLVDAVFPAHIFVCRYVWLPPPFVLFFFFPFRRLSDSFFHLMSFLYLIFSHGDTPPPCNTACVFFLYLQRFVQTH